MTPRAISRNLARHLGLAAILCCLAAPVQACRLALALTIDVSGSIDPAEYRFQMDGLADALADPIISEALVQAQAAVMVVQWSGAQDQEISIPWRRITDFDTADQLALQVRQIKRRWYGGKTAIGDALDHVIDQFAQVPDCTRRVIDVSGDGQLNDGTELADARGRARAGGFTVNGVAIDRVGRSITQFYRQHLMTGPNSFVVTSRGYSDYPETIRKKLFREVVVPAF